MSPSKQGPIITCICDTLAAKSLAPKAESRSPALLPGFLWDNAHLMSHGHAGPGTMEGLGTGLPISRSFLLPGRRRATMLALTLIWVL